MQEDVFQIITYIKGQSDQNAQEEEKKSYEQNQAVEKKKKRLQLEKWHSILGQLSDLQDEYLENAVINSKYAFYIQKRVVKQKDQNQYSTDYILGIHLTEASPQFKKLQSQKPRSIIITSGTLAPLKNLEAELGIDFNIKLEGNHVIDKENVSMNLLFADKKTQFKMRYHNLENNDELILKTGRVIENIIKTVEGGVLVFFQSYQKMENYSKLWRNNNILRQQKINRRIQMERRNNQELFQALEEFRKDNESENSIGGVFFGVCKGKLSEGIDFSDNDARCVIILGIPYSDFNDAKTVIKQEILDQKFRNKTSPINGQQWYEMDAMKSINQAMGRVIRHKNDFGTIVIIDSGLQNQKMRSKLSKWIKDDAFTFEDADKLYKRIDNFQKRMKEKYPKAFPSKRYKHISISYEDEDRQMQELFMTAEDKLQNQLKQAQIQNINQPQRRVLNQSFIINKKKVGQNQVIQKEIKPEIEFEFNEEEINEDDLLDCLDDIDNDSNDLSQDNGEENVEASILGKRQRKE
ncbi:fanconi anemia group j protein [Stylonychia lemnae]|uniref:Fanconi anemia group j protein n=1 Tax=Stylonychia lemnae TaxID=5949 RepID=A0A078B2P4_STYLE|nr:fanconi anemia group j protein [Stylonychia lemnae]|eukprot:CDW87763.1 fanconi anemia group j protein [Stylonychia lemnae]